MQTIEDVKTFWNANPLLTGELTEPDGTVEWFQQFDKVKSSVFLGDLSGFFTPESVKGQTVLDVGCGPGFWNRRLAPLGVTYYGIDISESSVRLAQQGARLCHASENICVDNAETLSSVADASIDHVISEGVIHHTPDTQACIDSIYRVLKPGGTAAVSVYYKTFYLRNPVLFRMARWFADKVQFSLKGRGRENMFRLESPDELVRVYDGLNNPIGKAYTSDEIVHMFKRFNVCSISYYYFPTRQLPISVPLSINKLLSKVFGLLILLNVEKR